MRRRWLVLALFGPALAMGQPSSPKVQLNGMLGSRMALLVIDGEACTLQVGGSARGVKLISLEDGRAVVETAGSRQTLQLGAAPARVLPSASLGRQIVMPVGPDGHYTVSGTINGQATSFLVDTGATSVAMSQTEATKLGVPYLSGKLVVAATANGAAQGHLIDLASIRIGDVEVRHVSAIVMPAQMPYVLLGNSFLNRFQMHRESDVMTLELRP